MSKHLGVGTSRWDHLNKIDKPNGMTSTLFRGAFSFEPVIEFIGVGYGQNAQARPAGRIAGGREE